MPVRTEANPGALDELVSEVRASAKYHRVCADLVRHLGAQELNKRSYRDAVKATRNKLHQVGGAYLDRQPHYGEWLEQLRHAHDQGQDAFRDACRRIMRQHASTRERLPILDHFYQEALAGLPPIQTVVDIACGFNPLAIPWMSLAPGATYVAVDIYEDLMAFLEQFITLCDVTPQVITHSVLPELPELPHASLALLLKAIPCLEQIDSDAGRHLLGQVQASTMLVSFPVASLGGRSRGMPAHYEEHFHALVAGKQWPVETFHFATELAFRITGGTTGRMKNPL